MRREPRTTARLTHRTVPMGVFRALALCVGLLCGWTTSPVKAQDRTGASRAHVGKKMGASSQRRNAARRAKRRAREKPAVGPEATPPSPAGRAARKERATDTAATRAASSTGQDPDSQVVKEGDTSVKVMRFSGLDVEGRLKSPQLLYFVNRVRAEFDRPRLPHRSFIPELERSTRRDPL